MNSKHIQHLFSRAGFGLNPQELVNLKKKSKKELVNELFKNSRNYSPLQIISPDQFYEMKNYKSLNAEERKRLQKMNRENVKQLNSAWINRIFEPKEILRERMTLFWANHFVCKDQIGYHFEIFNNILRKNALGNFGEFVKEVSKSASMIKYLNAKQNKKASPNENFARELMELFTLGIGNYSEEDIKESARAFTGWNHKLNGEFILRKNQHDYGIKTFFDETGDFDGDDVINIILQQKQCARFICTKIYSYFVSTSINIEHINELVEVFYPNYDISKLMMHIFQSKWFYSEEFIGTKIKSPIDLLASINKTVPFKFEKINQLLYLQKVLGQQLLNPINVAGWKGGSSWIDTNTLMLRLKLPSILLNNAVISLEGISDFEDTYEQYLKNKKSKKAYLKVILDWETFHENYKGLSPDEIQNNLLISNLSPKAEQLLNEISFSNEKDYCIQLMSLPEYQLC